MPTIPLSATVVASADIAASEFGDELVVLDLRDGVYYGLEDVGARVWRLVQRPVSVLELREALVAEYEVDQDRCERDVLTLVGELAAKGLVTIHAGT
jgi:coenzyme PQQ synthesis protein D (PqqD)